MPRGFRPCAPSRETCTGCSTGSMPAGRTPSTPNPASARTSSADSRGSFRTGPEIHRPPLFHVSCKTPVAAAGFRLAHRAGSSYQSHGIEGPIALPCFFSASSRPSATGEFQKPNRCRRAKITAVLSPTWGTQFNYLLEIMTKAAGVWMVMPTAVRRRRTPPDHGLMPLTAGNDWGKACREGASSIFMPGTSLGA